MTPQLGEPWEYETIKINGREVTIIKRDRNKWLAEWKGSDGKACMIVNTSRDQVVADVGAVMALRARVLKARY